MNARRSLSLWPAWLALLLSAGCFPEVESEQDSTGTAAGRLAVVCTTGQVAEMVTRIGGDLVQVETLMGYGVDPHLYKPSHGDLRRLRRAEAVFYSGLHLEGRLVEVLEKLGASKPTVAVGQILEREAADQLLEAGQFGGRYDPHVWFDLKLWSRAAPFVAKRLAELRPQQADTFRARASAYVDELHHLADQCRTELATIPPERRVLVTAHDAFAYFGRAYEIEVHGLQGISTADEADLATLSRLTGLLTSRGVKAVFVESSVPPKFIEALVEACRSRGHTVEIGGELYSDALGPQGSGADTLSGMMQHNVRTIAEALR